MTDQNSLVSIVIVNWNTRDLLVQCIRSVIDNTTDIAHEVIVVDNASSDGSVRAVRESFPQVKLIASEDNLGFAGGNNLGAVEATGEFLMLLNPDTVVPPGAVRALVDRLVDHPEIGVVGPLLLGADGQRQISSFGLFPGVTEAFAHATHYWTLFPKSRLAARFYQLPADQESWCLTSHLLGACMLMRRETWVALNGMDDGYFLFSEETDLCYRAARQGLPCAFFSDVSITHYGEQSVQSILKESGGLYIRSYNRFCRKFGAGIMKLALINAILVTGVFLGCGASLVRRRGLRESLNVLGALWYGYFRAPKVRGCDNGS